MKALYEPLVNKTNKYIEIVENVLEDLGVELCGLDQQYTSKNIFKLNDIDIVFLNWYEHVGASRYPFRTYYLVQKRRKVLKQLKEKNIKIITTFHNKTPHDLVGIKAKLNRDLLQEILEISDVIIYLSKDSRYYLSQYISEDLISRKAIYIPHPNYIGVYSDELQCIKDSGNSRMRFLFFGQIRKYKNIELVIKIAKKMNNVDIDFVIMGKCFTKKYEKQIRKLVGNAENIILKLGFVDDNILEEEIRKSDILVLPYDIKSSMNSGTAILAFSNGKTVICPKISTVLDYDIKNMYIYDYLDNIDHEIKLESEIRKAYFDWKNSRELFIKKGENIFYEVKEKNNLSIISHKYEELFEMIKL